MYYTYIGCITVTYGTELMHFAPPPKLFVKNFLDRVLDIFDLKTHVFDCVVNLRNNKKLYKKKSWNSNSFTYLSSNRTKLPTSKPDVD